MQTKFETSGMNEKTPDFSETSVVYKIHVKN
jgi:hypothetical protein